MCEWLVMSAVHGHTAAHWSCCLGLVGVGVCLAQLGLRDGTLLFAVLVRPFAMFRPPHDRHTDIAFIVDGVRFDLHKCAQPHHLSHVGANVPLCFTL